MLASHDLTPAGGRDQSRREFALLTVLLLATSAFAFQQISIVPILPAIQHNLHTSTAWSTWIVTGFLLVGAVATPTIGSLADRFGSKGLFQATLAAFVLASVGAACAPTIATLIFFRAVAGVAAALLALSLSLLSAHFRHERVTVAIGTIGFSFAAMNLIGTGVVPVLTDAVSWRVPFLLTSALGALGLGLSRRSIPASPPQARRSSDWKGAILIGLTIGSLMLALTEANTWGWHSLPFLGVIACSSIAALSSIRIELRVAHPTIDLRLLASRTIRRTIISATIMGFCIFSILILIPRFVVAPRALPSSIGHLVHYGFHASNTGAGFYMMFMMATGFAGGTSLGIVTRRWGWKPPLVGALALVLIGMTALGLWHDHPWQVAAATSLVGYGVPITTTITGKLVADAVPTDGRVAATGFTMVSFYVGGIIGAQLCAAILGADTIPGTAVARESAYTICFFLIAAVALAGIPVAALIGRAGQRSSESRGGLPSSADARSLRP